MEEGIEFDDDDVERAHEMKLAEEDLLWKKEDIEKHLDDNPFPDENIPVEDHESFDSRITIMEELVPNGVYKRILKQGYGPVITENNAVLYNLNAFLEGEIEPFDSTWLRGKPYLHKLNLDRLLEGVYRGLITMKKGERCELIVRPQYAYLEMGCPPRVPENATVLFIIEVMKTFEEGSLAHFETLSWEEKQNVDFNDLHKLCNDERISANSYFTEGRYQESAKRYRRAIRCLEQLSYKTREDDERAKELLLKMYNNIALTFNKIQRPMGAMANCKKALEIDPNCVKTLYIYAYAKYINGDYEAGKQLALKAQKLKPHDNSISSLLSKLDKRMHQDQIEMVNLYKNMAKGISKD